MAGLRFAAHADRFFRIQGPKWPIVRAVMAQWNLSGYTFLWLPDDDLDIGPRDINTMFRVAERFKWVQAVQQGVTA